MTTHKENVASEVQSVLANLAALERKPVTSAWFTAWSDEINRFNDLYMNAFIAFHGDTSDPNARDLFDQLQQEAKPKVERSEQRLNVLAATYNGSEHQHMLRKIRNELDVQTDDNVDLEAEQQQLSNAYNTLLSQQSVDLEEPVTVRSARTRLRSEPDRSKREWIWRQREKSKMADAPEVDDLFLKLVSLRQQMARNAGFGSYMDYAWAANHRYDYTPSDVARWFTDIADVFGDTQKQYAAHLEQELEVERLRPWDLEVTQRSPAQTRSLSEQNYLDLLTSTYDALSPEFGAVIRELKARDHIDLMARRNKVSTNFATVLTTRNEPIVFCNGTGHMNDLRFMLHECGHAVHHAHAGRGKLFREKLPPIEFAEFVAYVLQSLGGDHLERQAIFSDAEAYDYKRYITDFVLDVFSTDVRVERFQQWVYSHQIEATATACDTLWANLAPDSLADWSGLETFKQKGWQRTHILIYPLYNIGYIISWIATLIFFNRYRRDPEASLGQFKRTLSFGGTKGLKESFAALNISFPFRRREIEEAHAAFLREFFTDVSQRRTL